MSEPARSALHVLIVEDRPDTAQSWVDLLTLGGHTTRVASCGPDALSSAQTETPDVVLLDIGLPGMDGWEVARRLRADASGRPPFIIAMTGRGTVSDHHRSEGAGIDLHLVKPVDPVALIQLLNQFRSVRNRSVAPSE